MLWLDFSLVVTAIIVFSTFAQASAILEVNVLGFSAEFVIHRACKATERGSFKTKAGAGGAVPRKRSGHVKYQPAVKSKQHQCFGQ